MRHPMWNALRACAAVAVFFSSLVGFGVLGGIVVGKREVSAAQYQYDRVTICHVAGPHGTRVTITVSLRALPAHEAHGDSLGPCT